MERGPESQSVYSMDPDPLQWLWDGVSDFQTKFNDLHTCKIRNFHLPFDTAQHDANCGLNNEHTRMLCSCCKGALTFEEASHVKDTLTGQRAVPNEKELTFKGVPAGVCWGIENCKELFGLGSDKEALSAAFEAGTSTEGNAFLCPVLGNAFQQFRALPSAKTPDQFISVPCCPTGSKFIKLGILPHWPGSPRQFNCPAFELGEPHAYACDWGPGAGPWKQGLPRPRPRPPPRAL